MPLWMALSGFPSLLRSPDSVQNLDSKFYVLVNFTRKMISPMSHDIECFALVKGGHV